jgi:DNA-binding beta-propeller fold protein YncE
MRFHSLIFASLLALGLIAHQGLAGTTPDFVLEWGTLGAGDGQLQGTHGIVVDAAGDIYVADTLNHRIQKFTSEGIFLFNWGSLGTAAG